MATFWAGPPNFNMKHLHCWKWSRKKEKKKRKNETQGSMSNPDSSNYVYKTAYSTKMLKRKLRVSNISIFYLISLLNAIYNVWVIFPSCLSAAAVHSVNFYRGFFFVYIVIWIWILSTRRVFFLSRNCAIGFWDFIVYRDKAEENKYKNWQLWNVTRI